MKKNKKILIVSECFYPEEFKINDVALSWSNMGYEIDVLTLVPTYPAGKVYAGYKNRFLFYKEKYQGINIIRIRAVTGYKHSLIKKCLRYLNFMVIGSLIAIFTGKKYDYVFGWNGGALTDMLPAVFINKLYKKPTMFWVQDVWPDSVYAYGFKKTKILSIPLDIFVKFIYYNSTALAISSNGFKSKLEPYSNKNMNFHYAPNWADDLNMNMDAVSLSETSKVQLTFAGNIGKVQNLENIINAFNLLSEEYQKKSQLNIIGDGSNFDDLKLLAKSNENIIFHGKKPRADMASYYKASDFLIISLIDKPIFSVTVPAKTQTYIAAKKPILAIIKGDVAKIVNDNGLGVCSDPSNIDLIKNAYERCIDMPEQEKSKFIANNAHLLETTFNKKSIINKLLTQLIN